MGQFFGPETQGIDIIKAFPDRVRKKTFLLTGIDKRELAVATTEALAQGEAAALILLGPSQPETQPQIDDINLKYAKTKVIYITADFASLASVREAADIINKLDVPIDGIIGYPAVIAAEWATTVDGIESHFQINYLSHFLLVNLILGKMPDASRVVMISSSIRPDSPPLRFDNPNFSEGKTYHPLDGYAQSMFANIQFMKCLATSYAGRSMGAFSVNPGNIKLIVQSYVSPEMVASWLQKKKQESEDLPLILQQAPNSLEQASATVLRALLDPVIKGLARH
ncbi:short chain dehydrogenase [Aspergillus sclerotialis]|uniref:Short chain dehydrogenase n=1 Tax=Aspergillus sclerotialis TaxID=2070753 RepID=A0A3A2Z4I0_9EURO|nr:short chain dehydrogenase [Aspergillus sclerotialis]